MGLAITSAALLVLVGLLAAAATFIYLDAVQQSEMVRRLPQAFDQSGYLAPVVYDREGETELFSFHHSATEERIWLEADSLSDQQREILFALLDPSFRSNPGFEAAQLVGWLAGARPASSRTISQRVVELGLDPGRQTSAGDLIGSLQVALLAERLNQFFSKDQILTWFLNGAYFGNGAYGFDSAALLYFGEHVSELELAELVLLIRVAEEPTLNPAQTPNIARLRQVEAMESLYAAGLVSRQSLLQARLQPANFRNDVHPQRFPSEFGWIASHIYEQFVAAMGSSALETGGLRVYSSIDNLLQSQARCVLDRHLTRLQGQAGQNEASRAGASDCPAADLLPPLRPGDIGVDHEVQSGGLILLDPSTGEILAMTAIASGGAMAESIMPGEVFYPLIYLAAFTEGGSPGSMVLDISDDLEGDPGQGPIRIRTALANGYPYAALRTLRESGLENVQRISAQMGLERLDWPGSPPGFAGITTRTSLLDLSEAFAILANEGRRVAVETGPGPPTPVFVHAVRDAGGELLFEQTGHVQAVVSRELAYMINDVLRDEVARQPTYGDADPFQIGRPAAVIAGSSNDSSSYLTVGYTPDLLAAVWIGNPDGRATSALDRASATSPVWQAIMRYASAGTPVTDWPLPAGLVEVDVCDPSGLLPGEACPIVVAELFASGAEPIVLDDMYQAVRVNLETGRLATVETPIDQVVERVYLIPPPAAADWAERVNLARPPEEYDEISEDISGGAQARIDDPGLFEVVSGNVILRGHAHPAEFDFYRLQFGQGLNPDRWIQIEEDREQRVWGGILGQWDTTGLSGLYTVQLVTVDAAGTVYSAAVAVTVDNQPPSAAITYPLQDQIIGDQFGDRFLVEARAQDNVEIARVSFYIDGQLVRVLSEAPYLADLPLSSPGRHTLWAIAEDVAGNFIRSDPVDFVVAESRSRFP